MKKKKKQKKKILQPIKIKKKDKRCSNCKKFNGYRCSLFDSEEIPAKVFNKGCRKYKKNKHLYF